MCSFYTKLDLRQLPVSNPFLDDMTPTPVEAEVEVPNNIIVESPESSRHTAWTNMRRFPSLHRPGVIPGPPSSSSSSSPQSASRTISIYGPREMAKLDQHNYVAFNPQQQQRKTDTVYVPSTTASFHHKLQHHNRVDSFPQAMTEEFSSGTSSQSSTPRCQSPVSDDEEFSYLPSTPKLAQTQILRPAVVRQPASHVVTTDASCPEPLRFNKHKEQAAAQWMSEACNTL